MSRKSRGFDLHPDRKVRFGGKPQLKKRAPPPRELSPQEAIRASYPTTPPLQSRYLEYARCNGTPNPDVMLRRDEGRFPGGRMAGFILWIGARWAEYRTLRKMGPNEPITDFENAAFDAWLKAWVDRATSVIVVPGAP